MEFLAGPTLNKWIEQNREMPYTDIARYLAGVAEGLEAVHAQGIVHRDLKPANILIGERDGRREWILTDFGLAKEWNADAASRASIAGTFGYWSPEQALGKRVEPTSDTFCLGVVLYELLCHRLPFATDQDSFIDAIQNGRFVRPRKLVPRLNKNFEAIIVKSLEPHPGDRYQRAADLAADLRAVAEGEDPITRPLSRIRRATRAVYRRPLRTGVFVVIGVLLVALSMFINKSLQQAEVQRREADIQLLLREEANSLPDWGRIKNDLQMIARLDRSSATTMGNRVLDYLLNRAQNAEVPIEECVIWLSQLVPEQTAVLRQKIVQRKGETALAGLLRLLEPGEIREMLSVVSPFARTGGLFHLILPADKKAYKKISDLERVIKVHELLDPTGQFGAGPQHELLRTYLTLSNESNDYRQKSRVIAETSIALPKLSIDWKLTLVRDWVWLLCEMGDTRALTSALIRLDEVAALTNGTEGQFPSNRALGFLVEKARIHVALGDPAKAAESLDLFVSLTDVQALKHVLANYNSEQSVQQGACYDNVAGLIYMDAHLLRGFIAETESSPEKAIEHWRRGFLTVRGTDVETYYEAAMLGSLSGELNEDDAVQMIQHTAKTSGFGSIPLISSGIDQLIDSKEFIATVLRDSWVLESGHNGARQIVFRQMPFREHTTSQARFWIESGTRYAIAGWHNGTLVKDLNEKEQQLIEQIAHDARTAYLEGKASISAIAGLITVAHGSKPPIRNIVWSSINLPSSLKCSIAYVLGCHYENNLGDPDGANYFFLHARTAETGSLVDELLKKRHGDESKTNVNIAPVQRL
jgi:hypothetical protein